VVTTRHLAGLGTVLVSASGKTIYSPEQETHGQIRCTGSCLSFWFPVTVTSATGLHAPSGLTGVLGTIHRHDDGRTQLTYNGRPLYTFKLDQSPGQARGSNFTDSFGGTSFTLAGGHGQRRGLRVRRRGGVHRRAGIPGRLRILGPGRPGTGRRR
jgi:predicted lipoprotein with Yx(FWY)xxD motif